MVYLLLAWCWILFITISLGVLFYHRVASRLFSAILVPLPVTLYSLVGSCFLAWILAVTSFFLRIGWEVQVALSLFSLLIWIKDWQFLKKLLINGFKVFTANKLTFWCFNLLALLILLHAVQPPTFPDSGLYHIQFIKWLREYPVIPGLGNLHGRLAFNSHLHLLSAFFSSAAFGILALEQAFGSYLFLLFAFWQVRLLARSLALKEKWAFFYLGGLLLVLLVFRNAISSPMPDSSLTIFILFLLSLVIEKIRNKTLPIFDAATFLIALILLTTFTFKISIIYLSLVLLYLGWQLPLLERIKYLKVFLPLALLILLPWVGRNIILSGYFYYPFPVPDVLGMDWVIPMAKVKLELAEIIYFARRPAGDWQAAHGLSLIDWFPFWFARQELLDKGLLFMTLILVILQIIRLALQRLYLNENELLKLFLIFSVGALLWFFSAPALRFGYGYLFGTLLLGLMLLLSGKMNRFVLTGSIFIALLYGLNGIKNEVRKVTLVQVLRPAGYPQVQTVMQLVGSIPVRTVPGDGRCWNAALPCTDEVVPHLELRGTRVEDGFRIKASAR